MEEFFEERFDNQDYSGQSWDSRLYEECSFHNCQFVQVNMDDVVFRDCEFHNCEWVELGLGNVKLQELHFYQSRWKGLELNEDLPFPVSLFFEDSRMEKCSFQEIRFRDFSIKNSQVWEGHFASCDLRESDFSKSDLSGTIFEDNDLRKSDFRAAQNYQFDPTQNKIKGAKFSLPEVLVFLQPYGISIS